MAGKYKQVWSGEWEKYTAPFELACCSCGHTHELSLRVHEGDLQIKMVDCPKVTAKNRRKVRIEFDG